MKTVYTKDAPKSRQRKNPPSGVCFSFPWESICHIIQDFRVKHNFTNEKESVIEVFVDDQGVTFYTKRV